MSEILCYSLPGSINTIKKAGKWTKNKPLEYSFFVTNFYDPEPCYFVEGESSLLNKIRLEESKSPEVLTKEEYKSKVEHFVKFCNQDDSRKVVLSRTAWTPVESPDSLSIFESLVDVYPNAFVYLIQSEIFGCWIGATPEKLLRGSDKLLTTLALAGSRSINNSFEWTAKEIKEQGIVSDYIATMLKSEDVNFIQSERTTVQAGNIEHLSSEFSLNIDEKSPLEVALKLHPTPAVCGLPKKEAIQFIHNHEGYNRSLYTGIIGWSSNKETQLFVNLRCAQLFSNGVLSYVGGGITKDSDPEKEWLETEFKSQTLLSVIQKM